MQLPLQIAFRHMEPNDALEAIVREKAAKLDTFGEHIMSCRVVVQPAGKHHLHGNLYEVRLDIKLPQGEIAVTHEPSEHTEYKEMTVALRDAFDSARRQLEDYVRRQRADVKSLETLRPRSGKQALPGRGLWLPGDAGRQGNLLPPPQRSARSL